MSGLPPSFAGFRDISGDGPGPSRRWWDANAAEYTAEHGGFLEPQGLAVLGGDVFVADRAGQAISLI